MKSEDEQSKLVDLVSNSNLEDRIKAHVSREAVSFHTPGHKGRSQNSNSLSSTYRKYDLTELPGLDDLSHPTGVLENLETRLAQLWRSEGALISVNGASAGLVASVLKVAQRGKAILLPRNAHRSVINGLVLSGLKPIWYDPIWDENWGLWGAVDASTIADKIEAHAKDGLAAVLLVSPTYAGCVSEIKNIADVCHLHNLPLIVDEAHGAFLSPAHTNQTNAIDQDADLIVHSLHKHLGASTQTGVLHISKSGSERFGFEKESLRSFLSLVQSTSPNYLLLASIDQTVEELTSQATADHLEFLVKLGAQAKKSLSVSGEIEVYQPLLASPFHILVRARNLSPEILQTKLEEVGIYTETNLGNGTLLMLGIGTRESDVDALIARLNELPRDLIEKSNLKFTLPSNIDQVMSPREAVLASNRLVPSQQAEGLIAAECIAPCPPGWPVVVPGQRLGKNEIDNAKVEYLRVVTPDN